MRQPVFDVSAMHGSSGFKSPTLSPEEKEKEGDRIENQQRLSARGRHFKAGIYPALFATDKEADEG